MAARNGVARDRGTQLDGWILRYDLEATGPSRTTATLTYDWSAVPHHIREYLQFPPFPPDDLDNSLQHVSQLVACVSLP